LALGLALGGWRASDLEPIGGQGSQIGKNEPVPTSSTAQELEALELARCQLEAVLSGDENWRALRLAGADNADPAASAARQARNRRLEMALADNAHYQAWKHLNDAIDALRARPHPSLPQDAAQLVCNEPAARGVEQGPALPVPTAASERLAQRLGRLEPPQVEAIMRGGEGVRRGPDGGKVQAGPAVGANPPEASVTFVVREMPSVSMPTAEPLPEPPAAHLGGCEARPQLTPQPRSAGAVTPEEAEVTIISGEGRRQQREAEEQAGHVRRFRRALSGD
jgi:hypothetical protein